MNNLLSRLRLFLLSLLIPEGYLIAPKEKVVGKNQHPHYNPGKRPQKDLPLLSGKEEM
jgi:hypothetical protein